MLTKKDLEPIIETYYKNLEEGKILGRKCTRCGHTEFPPYLCCNTCGCLDTEWTDLTDMRGVVKQVLPTFGAFGDPDFRKAHGDYWAIEVNVEGIDPFNTSLMHVDDSKLGEFTELIRKEEVIVKPLLIQDEDTKVVVWELVGHDEFNKEPVICKEEAKEEVCEKAAEPEAAPAAEIKAEPVSEPETSAEDEELTKVVIECAATGYEVDPSTITADTDIREDLSNESMKMIVMISEIEDKLNVTIEIPEAGNLNTIRDFVNKVKELSK